jgi:hypothetical protein
VSDVERFARYAADFEKSYATDDWSHVEPWFHEDAVYEVGLPEPFGGVFEGRDAILAYFPRILNALDRRFATRTITLLDGPRIEDGAVWILGRADYTAAGVPDLGFELEELATFDGDRIRRLEDRYDAENVKAMLEWLDSHAETIGIER